MARPKSHFPELDVRKAARGAVSAGLKVARVEIDRDGKVVVYTGRDDQADEVIVEGNTCDKAFG